MLATLRQVIKKLTPLLRLQPVAIVAVLALVTVSVAMPGAPADAQLVSTISWVANSWAGSSIISSISQVLYIIFVSFMGIMSDMMVRFFVQAAGITGFTTLPAVQDAWSTVRDLSNMFFIVILLFIAFGTLLNIEAYSWKQLLPKMVMAAILVNFSLAIVGIVVDASQIVMLTFLEAIKPAASQGFVTAFQLSNLTTFSPGLSQGTNEISRLISIITAGVMLSTLVMVTLIYLVLIVGRLAMIWFLAVLSPLAFTMMVLPSTEKYFQQWFEMLTRYAVLGPMMLFFMWLALFIAARSATTSGTFNITNNLGSVTVQGDGSAGNQTTTLAATPILSENGLLVSFVLSIMMLMAGLKLSQDSASEMSEYVGKAAGAAGWFTIGAVAGYAYNGIRGGASKINDAQFGRITDIDLSFTRWNEARKNAREAAKGRRFLAASARAGSRNGLGIVLRQFGANEDFAKAFGLFHGTDQTSFGVGGLARQVFVRNRNATKLETEREALAKSAEEDQKKLDQQIEEFSKKRDRRTKEQEVVNAKTARDQASTASSNARSGMVDLTTGSASRVALEQLYNRLNDEYKEALDKTPEDTAKLAQLATKRASAKSMLDVDGGSTDALAVEVNDNIKADLVTEHEKQKERLDAKVQEAEATTVIADTPEQFQSIMEIELAALRKSIATKKDAMTTLSRKIAMEKPTPTMTTRQKFSQQMEEATKDVSSNNENELVAQMTRQIASGNFVEGLGLARYLSQVGHTNEIISKDLEAVLKQYDSNFEFTDRGPEGIRQFADFLIKKGGLDDQQVYGALDDIARNSQNNNHWTYAQLIGMRDGKRVFRSKEDYQAAQFEEARKYSASSLVQNGNRLAVGDYDMEGNYRLAPHLASFVAESFHTFEDLAKKSRFSDNMAAWLNQDDKFFKLVMARAGDNREQALRTWKFVFGGTGNFGPAQASTSDRVKEALQQMNE